MISQFQKFKDMHNQNEPFLLSNVWNAQSAKNSERLGFKSVGTSSAAIAHSLGYEDGENMPFNDYLFIIENIMKSITIPLSVDIESGYGKDEETIISNISKLASLGVVGINIEDSIVKDNVRILENEIVFSEKLNIISNYIKANNIEMFLNVRTDTFLLNRENAMSETLKRIKLYEQFNIDGIFLPCITNQNDIKKIVENTILPINVMCMPELPNFDILKSVGVKRISMGNFINDYIYNNMSQILEKIIDEKSFNSIF
jgi:2-methylisocitrate lyase-like PEP mutase family enzyme